MNLKKYMLLSAAALVLSTPAASARDVMKKIYMYGFSASFNDSTVYVSDVMPVDSAWFDSKTNFLRGRDQYSDQLRNYFKQKGMPFRTCVVEYAATKEAAEKMRTSMMTRYSNLNEKQQKKNKKRAKRGENEVTPILYIVKNMDADFAFKSYTPWEDTVEGMAEAAQEKKKNNKKPKKEKRPAAPKQGMRPGDEGPENGMGPGNDMGHGMGPGGNMNR
ncbi:hypothetical protein [Prevotella sp. AGR2160]|uniref:hypothetical protein n=1 Tax=Prevotella sp. AGR2160 TaxID=1280674 RepID=UPI0012DD6B27|nr:hypothetical protein [Prevotella sp. AGR2160]